MPKSIWPDSVVVTLRDGRRLILDPWNIPHRQIIFTGSYEPAETQVLSKLLHSGQSVLDIGANIGWYTTLFSKLVGLNGRVISAEPQPQCFKELCKNIEANDNSHNIVILNIALSERKGEGLFYIFTNKPDTHSSLRALEETNFETIRVQLDTVDGIVAKYLNRLSLMKIDVEGAEREVVTGSKKTLMKDKPIVMIEVHRGVCLSGGYKPESIFRLFRPFGYLFFKIASPSSLERITNHTKLGFIENILCIHKSKLDCIIEDSGLSIRDQ